MQSLRVLAMPTKKKFKGRRSTYWQRWIVLIAAIFVVYTVLRPGPQIYSVNTWTHDLTSEAQNGDLETTPYQPLNDSRILSPDSPLSPVPRYGCPSISAKRKIDVNGTVSGIEMLKAVRSTYITKFSSDIHYAHVAMLEKIVLPDGKLRFVSAWQAAPLAPFVVNPNNGDRYQRVAVEGLPMQRLYWATSDDEGRTWSEGQMVPPDPDAKWSAYWSPVLFYDSKNSLLWLFYSVSNTCQKIVQNTTLWEPGGDIRAKVMNVGGHSLTALRLGAPRKSWTWGKGRTILRQKTDGIPKVIANKPTVLTNGDWAMPFWREQPPKDNNSTCSKDVEFKSRHMYGHIANRTSSGVLISTDEGRTWNPFGDISEPRTNLIEGSLVEVMSNGRPEVHLYFRAIVGCVFRSISFDYGRTWSRPEPLPISNPNTKFSVVQIHPFKGTNSTLTNSLLVMAFNNHKRGQPGCLQCRTHLHLAGSVDYGNTWTQIAIIESEFVEGVRIHYPTMMQSGSELHLIYSRFYLGKYNLEQCEINQAPCLGLYSKQQGIKFVTVDISSLYSIPQLYAKGEKTQKLANTAEKLLMALIDLRLGELDKQFTGDEKLRKIQNFRDAKWDRVVNMIMSHFVVDNVGGIHEVRRQNQLLKFFKQVLEDRLQSKYGHGLLKPRHQQRCSCTVHHPFTGFASTCNCDCRDNEDCVLLCHLGIANCGPQPIPAIGNSRLGRNSDAKGGSKRRPNLRAGHHTIKANSH